MPLGTGRLPRVEPSVSFVDGRTERLRPQQATSTSAKDVVAATAAEVSILTTFDAGNATTPSHHTQLAKQAPEAAVAQAQFWINTDAQTMQIDPFMDPAVRANPVPCARAKYEAEQAHQLYPRCYADADLRRRAAAVTAIPVIAVR